MNENDKEEPSKPDPVSGESPDPSQPAVAEVSSTSGQQSVRTPEFKDRRTGLILFGLLQVFMGVCSALLIPMMLLALTIAPKTQPELNFQTMAPMLGIYALFAVVLIWLGAGSILARRWARALTLVLAWTWLIIGAMSMIMMVFFMPNVYDVAAQGQQVPPEMRMFMQVVMTGTLGCMYLFLPGSFVLFYQSQHVKATCDARDPHIRWTDKCPLPVLAMSLMLGYGSLSIFFTAGYGFVMPFFGMLLKGLSGGLVMLAFSLLSAYLAWATYRLKISAWWTMLVVYLILGVSSIITFTRFDMMDMYREMDIPADQLKIIEESGMLTQMNMPLMFGLGFAFFIGYMLWVRKHFVAVAASNTDS